MVPQPHKLRADRPIDLKKLALLPTLMREGQCPRALITQWHIALRSRNKRHLGRYLHPCELQRCRFALNGDSVARARACRGDGT